MLLCSMAGASTATLATGGCGDDGGAACALNEDCASGFCRADGTCGAAPVDAAPAEDAPPPDGDGATGLCTPNHDGQLVRGEIPLAAGRMATFRVATNPTFATAGTTDVSGRRWDLTGALAGDQDRVLTLLAPTGTWWAATFPTATYATTLAAGSDLLGVFALTDTELTLLGVVSPAAGTSRTELSYDPPAKILALPITADATWTSTSTVTGLAQGITAYYTEAYASTVDQAGAMVTPYGEFPSLRVATDLTRSYFGSTLLTKRTFAWMAECFGAVANASSQDNEGAAEFTDPAEVRRLVP